MDEKRKGRPTPPPLAVTPGGENVLKALRNKLGLTQEQVALRGGINASSYVSAEIGRNKLGLLETLEGVARGLYLTLDELRALIRGEMGTEDLAKRVLDREPDLRARLQAAPQRPPVAPN